MGNGGSAATALHFANDLQKACGRNVICLNGNMSLLTAYSNDDGYESVFSSQLTMAGRMDALVAISCSGNSLNILRAVCQAKEVFKMATIGFTGNDGGKLAEEADYVIKVPYEGYEVQEDAHMALCHAIAVFNTV